MTPQQQAVRSVTTAGVRFHNTDSGQSYLCTNDHRGNAGSTKSIWLVSEEAEYSIFNQSVGGGQSCESGHYWGFIDKEGTTELGTRGEVLAKFTGLSEWHGYPIKCSQTRPPTKLVKKLRDELQVISESFALRIMTQKV